MANNKITPGIMDFCWKKKLRLGGKGPDGKKLTMLDIVKKRPAMMRAQRFEPPTF